jgi:hypothetical protein
MAPAIAQVLQDRGVSAAGVGEHVGQQGEAGAVEGAGGQDALVVEGLRQLWNGAGSPVMSRRICGHGAERVAGYIAEK